MSIDYRFVPIDLDITTHPKACAAGPEAMGLWLWGMAFAKLHATHGKLPRHAVLAAWGGRRNVVLAKKLVDSGLWSRLENGDWEIWNFSKKQASSTSSAERMRRLRERQKSVTSTVTCDVTRDASNVTCDANDVTEKRHMCSISPSISFSEEIQESETGERDRATPPDWFEAVLGTVGMTVEPIADPGAAWLRYRGHRAKKHEPMSVADAEYWITTVIVKEQREERERRRRADDRDRENKARFGKPAGAVEHEHVKRQIDPKRERELNAELAAIVAARKETGT